MEKFNGKIITISGEPVSGKGTVVSKLKELYKKSGYKVSVINTGALFRKAAIMEYKKMHPEIESPLISVVEHDPDFADELEDLDRKFDTEFMPNLVKEFNEKAGENEKLIIDSRLAWYFIPDTFDIRLTVDSKIAGERVFKDKKRGKEDQFSSLEDATSLTKQRKQDEIDRYKKVYGIDLTDEDNYDLIINTSLVNADDVIKVITICTEYASKGKPFCKTWASPKTFYPTQKIGETYGRQPFPDAMTLPEIAESIKKNGIYPDEAIGSITRGTSLYQFVTDGHHRVFGSIIAGITLIPYKVIKHIEKETVEREYLSYMYDYEDLCTEPDGTKFRYAEYPPLEEIEMER